MELKQMNKRMFLFLCAALAACGGGNVAPTTTVGVGTSTCVANCAGAGPSSINSPGMAASMRTSSMRTGPRVNVGVGMAVRR